MLFSSTLCFSDFQNFSASRAVARSAGVRLLRRAYRRPFLKSRLPPWEVGELDFTKRTGGYAALAAYLAQP
jgi:hypothetical protein